MPDFDPDNPLSAEIMAERASAYFSTIRKMESALGNLARFDQAASRLADSVEKAHRREELFAEACEQVWNFAVLRDAMKLPFYEEVFSEYGVPDEVKKQMGPKAASLKTGQ